MIKYCAFFLSFFKSLILIFVEIMIRIHNSKFMDPDSGGQLVTDPPDTDPQHCLQPDDYTIRIWIQKPSWIRIRIFKLKNGSCNISIPILPVEHGPDVVGIAWLVLDGVVSVRIELDQNDDAVGRLGELVRRLLSCCLPRTGLPSENIRQGFQYFDRTKQCLPIAFLFTDFGRSLVI
jgi:hypothetical protein